MKIKYLFLGIVFSLVTFFQTQVAFAANCTDTAGATCQASCTGTVVAGPFFDCAGSTTCCKAAAATAPTTGTSTDSNGVNIPNPLGYDSVEQLLSNILGTLQKIIVTLALVSMVIGAVLYVTSAGVEKQVTWAKDAIGAAMIGLALGIAAPSLLKEISTILNWKTDNTTVNNALTLSAIAINVLNFLLGVFGVLSLIMMIVGAGMYLTSAGDEDRIDKGKDIFKYSVLGIIIAMSAMVLVRQIAKFFV
ncbi:MAG: hypothetical protein WCF93_04895 [Candidatus Moraniibacteriota bacterium]